MSGREQLTPFAVLERHRTECKLCDLFSLCSVGAALLERASKHAAERLCPMPSSVHVLDLDAHTRGCVDCRPNALCDAGRAIAREIGDTYLELGKRLPTGRPC